MTVPLDPAAPPPFPLPAAPSDAPEPWQRRFELLALLLVVAVALVLVSAVVVAHAQLSDQFATFPSFASGDYDLTDVIRVGGSSANLAVAGALLVAMLLVTLGPADRFTGRGRLVLRSTVVIGLVTAGLAGTSGVLTVIDRPDEVPYANGGVAGFPGEGLLTRLASVAPLLVAAVLAGYVAWCAFAALEDAPADPVDPAEPADAPVS